LNEGLNEQPAKAGNVDSGVCDNGRGLPDLSAQWRSCHCDKDLVWVGDQDSSDNFSRIEIWHMKMPDPGTHNVVVTFSSAPDSATVGVMTFTGVDQTTPLGTFTSATADSTNASTTVSSAAGELVFDTMVLESSSNRDLVPEASQTERWDVFESPATNGGGSTEPGAASVQMSWSWSGADKWAIGAVPIKPSPPPLYRSVGTNGGNLNTGNTVEISGTTATFSGPMPDNIGVGDVLQYNDGTWRLAFIYGRTSDTIYTVKSSTGDTPQAAPALTAVGVYRAYTSLFNWEAQNENDTLNDTVENFDTSTDLVTNNTVMMAACYGDGADTSSVTIDGWTTGASNYIQIYTPFLKSEVGASQRHDGKWDTSAYRLEYSGWAITVSEEYVRIDGLQIRVPVDTYDSVGIYYYSANGTSYYEVSNSIIRGPGSGTEDWRLGLNSYNTGSGVFKIWNNLVYDWAGTGTLVVGIAPDDPDFTNYIYNNTVVDCLDGIDIYSGTVIAKNNLVYSSNVGNDNYDGSFNAASTNNLSGPDTGTNNDAPGSNPRNDTDVTFVNEAGDDFHLSSSDAGAKDYGTDLSADPDLVFYTDIDMAARSAPWDIGADDTLATTAVELLSFEARGLDGTVELTWETGSELDNLGFHLYRSSSEAGPFERITRQVIPGLGSSPAGARYSYPDTGLTNDVTYYYKLEDIETTGPTEKHGPVSATPRSGVSVNQDLDDSRITIGDPSANHSSIIEESPDGVVLELITEGFYALPQEDGTVLLEVPGFQTTGEEMAPSLPVWRSWVEAVAGRQVKLVSVETDNEEVFELTPSDVSTGEVEVSRRGTVRLSRRRQPRSRSVRQAGWVPTEPARLIDVGYQSEVGRWKKSFGPGTSIGVAFFVQRPRPSRSSDGRNAWRPPV
jgi:hypothetical protein